MKATRFALTLLGAVCFTGLGLWLGRSDFGKQATRVVHYAAVDALAERADLGLRQRLLLEHPEIVRAVRRGGAFGGDFSPLIGQNMFSRDPDVIAEARSMTRIVEVAARTWHIRLPIVNAVLFETDEGLLLVDTGMAPAGPAVLDAIRQVSDTPIHTIVYTHGHVDHAYGTWALIEAGESPQIVAQERLPDRFERYIRLRGSIARYMSQPADQLPARREDLVWPTRTFEDRLELEIGGETFVLIHHPGETDDQLYVWAPERRVLASADYYQGFLPNAGNGKRVQRFVEEWAVALREMAALKPAILLPAHGDALSEPGVIHDNLLALAEALEFIVASTIDGLNEGLRKDQVYEDIRLPAHLVSNPTLREQYVSAKDIAKMVIKRHTGWWSDLPSQWSPAPLEVQAAAIAQLAGGLEDLVSAARRALEDDVRKASHLTDWAWLAAPEHPAVQQLVIDVYLARIVDPESNTQEILAYIDAMVAARQRQLSPVSTDR